MLRRTLESSINVALCLYLLKGGTTFNNCSGLKNYNHVGARHCRKPLGRSVRQSFNKQEPSNFYYCEVGPICMICIQILVVYKSCQNISGSVGMTKSRAFASKSR